MTIQTQLPVPYQSAQSPEAPACAGDQPNSAGDHAQRHTIFSPQAQAKFLDNLSINGNVRHACKVARVSPQTAYRARRQSAAFAQLWDAALLSARDRAEEVLADRALKGTEESVFYHGEEVATRIRYDSRLLLAHLARLDRLAARAQVSAALHEFDDAVEALGRGEALPEAPSEGPWAPTSAGAQEIDQDSVPSVPSCRTAPAVSYDVEREAYLQRVADMDYARPGYAKRPRELAEDHPYLNARTIEAIQLHAFEDGEEEEWWLVIPTAEEWAALAEAEGGERESAFATR